MVQACCVVGCNENREDVTYFKFPNSRTLKRKWLDAFTPLGKVTLDSVVCSRHFLDDQYELVRGKKRLKAKVVPSLFDGDKPQPPQKDTESTSTIEQNGDGQVQENGTTDESTQRTETTDNISNNRTEVTTDNISNNRTEVTTDNINNNRTEVTTDNISNNRTEVTTDKTNNIVTRTVPNVTTFPDEDDIEDIITHFHIKQLKPLHAAARTSSLYPYGAYIIKKEVQYEIEKKTEDGVGEETVCGTQSNGNDVIDVDNLKDTVFIEVSVDNGSTEPTNGDCLMLLESVQCEVDPNSLVFQEPDNEEPEADDDVVHVEQRKEDPISLLTSSDEDDVIIQEPKIDTVEVSDETDEDDRPLVKLTGPAKRPKKSKKKKSTKSKKSNRSSNSENNTSEETVGLYEYYCIECSFRITNKSEFKDHKNQHTRVLQVCQICDYTTASEAQFTRHKRKHQDDKKFKCHLCDYRARHNMSLIYHMKAHDGVNLVNTKNGYRCDKCGFKSDVKMALVKHIRMCTTDCRRFSCNKCNYETSRQPDLRRHKMRRHLDDSDDDDD